MALSDPLQLIVIAVIVNIIFIFGPNKIPEIARSIGKARRQFESASKEFQQITKEIQKLVDLFLDKASPRCLHPRLYELRNHPE